MAAKAKPKTVARKPAPKPVATKRASVRLPKPPAKKVTAKKAVAKVAPKAKSAVKATPSFVERMAAARAKASKAKGGKK